jgi:hypothetical protein
MVSNFREYGFDPKRDIIVTSQRGIGDEASMEDLLDEDSKRRIHGKVIDKYELYFRTESEKDARLSAEKSDKSIEEFRNELSNIFE